MPHATTLRLLLLISTLALWGIGCRSFTGYPHALGGLKVEKDTLNEPFQPQSVKDCQDKIQNTTAQQAEKNRCRNELVDGRIRAIDLEFYDFERSLNLENNGISFAGDVAALSLSGAGTIVTGAGTKTVLAALSGLATGTKSSIDKDVYYAKTLPALLITMESLRSKKLTDIRKSETADTGSYTLSAALADVDGYYNAGSIPAALTNISATAGAAKVEAEAERTEPYGADENTKLLRHFWMPDGHKVNKANEAALKEEMTTLHEDGDVDITLFLNAAKYEDARAAAVKDLHLKP